MFCQKPLHQTHAQADTMSWWSCQSPVAHSCELLNHTVSVEDCLSLTQNLMQIRCSTCSVILNEMVTQYTCSLNSIYCPCWLGKSSLFPHAHSSPLSLAATLHQCHTNHSHCINNGWTFSRQTSYIIKIHMNFVCYILYTLHMCDSNKTEHVTQQ